MNRISPVLIFSLAGIVLVLLAGGGFFAYTTFFSQDPEQPSSPDAADDLLSEVSVIAPSPEIQATPAPQNLGDCVPFGSSLTDRVINTDDPEPPTVEEVLRRLRPTQCRTGHGLPVTHHGYSIIFYRMGGCYGQTEEEKQAAIEENRERVEELMQRYWVIQTACNPNEMPV